MSINDVDRKLNKIKNVTPVEYTAFVCMHKLIEQLKPEIKNACEVGCGDGDFLLFFEDYGIPILGVDISKESVDIAKSKITKPHVRAEVRDIVDLKDKFDIVFALNVLEHTVDDDACVKNLARLAKKLVVTVPAHQMLYSTFDKNVGHVRRYGKKDLVALLEKNGFKVEEVYSMGSILFHIYANVFNGKKKLAVEGVREFNKFSELLVRKINIIHKIFYCLDMIFRKFDFGIVYYVVARNMNHDKITT